MDQPRVSIIITNHNYASFLPDAIQSALQQRYPAVETIVVDDGSTDSSLQILEQYQQRHPELRIITQSNQGQAVAFQTGINAASGEYILFLDADDTLDPDAIQIAIQHFDRDVVNVQFALRCVDEHRHQLGWQVPAHFPSSDHYRELLLSTGGYPTPPTSGNVWSRSFLETVFPLPSTLGPIAADGYLNWLAPFFGRIVSIAQALGEYRIHTRNRYAQADSMVDPPKLERSLRTDIQRIRAIATILQQQRVSVDVWEVLQRNADHIRRRFMLSRLDPARYATLGLPVPSVKQYTTVLWRSSEVPRPIKALWSIAGFVLALSPQRWRPLLAHWIWNANRRPQWLSTAWRKVKALSSTSSPHFQRFNPDQRQ